MKILIKLITNNWSKAKRPLFFILCIIPFTQVEPSQIIHRKPVQKNAGAFYQNPVIPGDFGDPSIVLVGKDYTIAKSTGDGILIMQSQDLVNWKPILRKSFEQKISGVWAVDLQYFNGKYHLYIPVGLYEGKVGRSYVNMVMMAEKPEGPWTAPVNLEIPIPDSVEFPAIDPGFIMTPEGKKYLFVSQGYIIPLNDEGTKAIGEPRKVYDGWDYPAEWNVECKCLESPKLFMRDGYYYLVSAQGGTSGPSTAHMIIVARSKSVYGPWVNSPYNPLVHTYSQDEKWWQQGHGTIFKATDGDWWTIYHARLNGFTEMGRQALLMPVEWTEDGWPVIKKGCTPDGLFPMPPGEKMGHGMILSDSFFSDHLGLQWLIPNNNGSDIKVGNGRMVMKAKGTSRNDHNSISVKAIHKSFEVSVEVFCSDSLSIAGLEVGGTGVATDGTYSFFSEGPTWRVKDTHPKLEEKNHIYFMIRNFRKDLSFFYSNDGKNWISYGKGLRINNSYEISLFASGKSEVSFANFKYLPLE